MTRLDADGEPPAQDAGQKKASVETELLAHESLQLMAHDLRNCLGVGFAEIDFLLAAANLDPDSAEALQGLYAELEKASSLIDEFVGVGEHLLVGAGERRWLAVPDLLQRVARSFEEGSIVIEAGVAELCVYPVLVERMLAILVRNATRHAVDGPVRLEARPGPGGRGVVLSVTNRGRELPEIAVAAIEGRKMQGASGLAFCRYVCREEGGQLRYSREGERNVVEAELACEIALP